MRNDEGGRGMELLGLGLASGAVLGSQIAMTRILSLKYAANQTFLVVSFAVLGLAVGRIKAALCWLKQQPKPIGHSISELWMKPTRPWA